MGSFRRIQAGIVHAVLVAGMVWSARQAVGASLFDLLNPVQLEWNPSPSTNVIGYRLHFGSKSRLYSFWLDVGNTNSATISSILLAFTNYITITAYDQDGVESEFSNEVGLALPRGNDTPIAQDDLILFPPNTAVRIHLQGEDGDGDPLTYRIIDPPDRGTLLGSAPDLIYLPGPDGGLPDSFTFQISDGLSDSPPAAVLLFTQPTVSLTQISLGRTQAMHTMDRSPTVLAPSAGLHSLLPFNVAGGLLTAIVISNASLTDTILLDPSVNTGTPPPSSAVASAVGGQFGFPFLQLSLGASATLPLVEKLVRGLAFDAGPIEHPLPRTVRITLTDSTRLQRMEGEMTIQINHPPTVRADPFESERDTVTLLSMQRLLQNDLDPDGDPLTLVSVSTNSPAGGKITLSDTNISYTPPPGFEGWDSFSYTVADDHGGESVGQVEIHVFHPVPVGQLKLESLQKSIFGKDYLVFSFYGEPDREYELYATDALGAWFPIMTRRTGSNGFVLFPNVQVETGQDHFFRVQSK